MKAGTKVHYTLITDSRFSTDILSDINNLFNKLCDSIEDKLSIDNIHALKPELLQWQDNTEQYRMNIQFTLLKNMTQNEVYKITNSVKASHLTFKQPKTITIKYSR